MVEGKLEEIGVLRVKIRFVFQKDFCVYYMMDVQSQEMS